MKKQLELFLDDEVMKQLPTRYCNHSSVTTHAHVVHYVKCTCCDSTLEAVLMPLSGNTPLSESSQEQHGQGVDSPF